ncbi:MAG: glycosyltransferase [Alphaproteobacteria bacterium]|jgi:glycosyltransferase involved in cell wall biosynthesis|nr:glycosyltransferase [Alphaproteobacteria bacterium]|tara:strand:- start:739 stop:1722 length:984 start_codon:yes stop_codon:yes gene_type:complete
MTSSFAGKSVVILTAQYNDWVSLAHLLPLIDETLVPLGVKARVVVVDDGSIGSDGKNLVDSLSLKTVKSIEEVVLGDNQGNQRAMAIGLAHVAEHHPCDYLLLIDSDFEDKPEYIPQLLETCRSGRDKEIVFAERTKRSEGMGFLFFYRLYQKIYKAFTRHNIAVGNFSVVPGHLIRRLAHVGELWNHLPASIMRSGLPFTSISTLRGKRRYGKSSMNLARLVVHAFSAFTVFADVFAVRLILWTLGLVFLFVLGGMVLVGLKFGAGVAALGWPLQILGLLLVILIQVLGMSVILLFLALSMRLKPPMIPLHDYKKFIYEVTRLYPS